MNGKTVSLYLTAKDMELLKFVLEEIGQASDEEDCVRLGKQAARAGINRLLQQQKDQEVKELLRITD